MAGRPNVLLVTLDTVRADHVGCYGATSASTPTLDALAASGVRFTTAVAHAPLTAPSHASILTGRTPLGTGVRDNGAYVLPEGIRSVAEDFKDAGYQTAAFVSGFPLTRRFGLDRGFATYDDHLPRGSDPRRTAYVERTADRTTDAALHWLESAPRAQPFFLWVHYFDAHAPYEPPAEFAARARSPYDGEIAFVDSQLGRLTSRIDGVAGAGRTVVIVLADHGESLGEHGEDTHGIFLYDATLRVPFVVSGPGVPAGKVADTVARGIDVAPTLMDLAGLAVRKGLDGRSLRQAVTGQRMDDAPAYSESLHSQLQYGWAPLHSLRTDRFKLIEAPRPELYDLKSDAGETHDQAAQDPTRLSTLRAELQKIMTEKPPAAAQAIDAETAARLDALGYIGTAGGAAPVATGRDPKDGIALVTRLGRNGMSTARTEPLKAIQELTALLAEDPGMLVVLRTRAVAYETAGQYDNAVRDLRALEKKGALSAEDSVVLGDSLRMGGHDAEAIAVLEGTARKNPRFTQPRLSLAAVYMAEKRLDQAAGAYDAVLKVSPDQTEALRGLGDLAVIRGDNAEAEKRYSRILEIDASDPGALSKLGVVRLRQGRGEEGIALFRKAVDKEPGIL